MIAAPDRFAAARAVADTVLYEGYVLYPYRASAAKNQLRWQFGVLAPRRYAEADGHERWRLRTEVMVDPGTKPTLFVRVRCLQVQRRDIEMAVEGSFVPTDRLDVDGTTWVPWDEAVDHEIDLDPIPLLPLREQPLPFEFELPASSTDELLRTPDGTVVGRAVRSSDAVAGSVTVACRWADAPGALLHVSIEVENRTAWTARDVDRDAMLQRALVATHTLLAVDDGAFLSMLDPPDFAGEAIRTCANEGTFPVLIGDEGSADVVLSSPIILYDHPAVAEESQGDFCDATEIDEILALRVLTLTDEEKAEARGTDQRAAAIIDRCDDMPPELWERLHGAVRSLGPALDERPAPEPSVPWWDPGIDASVDPSTDTIDIGGVLVGRGTKVRLRPSRRADAHDLFLAGERATVAGIFSDVDGAEHVAVTIDDDPATEMLEWQKRYLYFHPEEIEPVR